MLQKIKTAIEETEDIIVEFQAVKNDDCISGYMYLEDADDEEPLHFYDAQGLEIGTHLPYQDNALYEAFTTDGMLIQYLVDFATENKTIERDGYTLIINGVEPNTFTATIPDAVEIIEKTVKASGNTGRVYVPVSWVGREVKIVLLK